MAEDYFKKLAELKSRLETTEKSDFTKKQTRKRSSSKKTLLTPATPKAQPIREDKGIERFPKGKRGMSTAQQRAEIANTYRPWTDPKSRQDVYWAGMTEREWSRAMGAAHDEVANYGRNMSDNQRAEEFIRRFPKLAGQPDEVEALVRYALGSEADGYSRHHLYAVPHTISKEQQLLKQLEMSGLNPEALGVRNLGATDIKVPWNNIGINLDAQDMTVNPRGQINLSLGVLKNTDPGRARRFLERHGQTGTIGQLFDDLQSGNFTEDKLLAKTGDGRKDYLMGNVVEKNSIRNLLGDDGRLKGNFDPSPGLGEYAIDLRELESNIRDVPLTEFSPQVNSSRWSNPRGTTLFLNNGRSLGIGIPYRAAQHFGGGKGLIEKIIDPDVLDAVEQEAVARRARRPKNSIPRSFTNSDLLSNRFHSVLPGIDLDSVRTNVKGEALGAVIGAVTDKDTMHDLGRGDYKSAGTRMAGDALTGGIAGGAIQAAGKAVAPLAAKAVGTTVAGMAGAAVAPAAAAYGLAQVPDAMVAYRGGQQGRTFEEQKAKERAENVSAYKQAFGGTSAGYRAPRVTTPVAKPAPKPEPRKVTWKDRRNFRRGTR